MKNEKRILPLFLFVFLFSEDDAIDDGVAEEKEEKEKEKYLTYLNLQKKIVQHLREVAIVVYSRTYLNFSPKSLNTRMNCFPEMKSK